MENGPIEPLLIDVRVAPMEMCVSENAVFEDVRFIACFIGKAGSQAFVKPESLEIFVTIQGGVARLC